jgi:hypothetical protein
MVDTYRVLKCALHSEWVSIKHQGKQWSLENFSDSAQLIGIIIKHKYHITCVEDAYGGADKSLARTTSRFILFDGENISFDASLVIYTKSTNIPPIMIIDRIYEHQYLLLL